MWCLKIVLIVVVCCMAGTAYGSIQTTSVEVYTDGLAHISTQITPEEGSPALNVALLGSEIDNFIATGQNNILLTAEMGENSVLLNTFDSDTVLVKYDVHDLISKDGRIWTFAVDSNTRYTLIMPDGAVIVGMNVIPIALEMVDGKAYLEIPSGEAVITYILSADRDSIDVSTTVDGASDDNMVLWVLGMFGALGAFVAVWYYRRPTVHIQSSKTASTPESIFERIPDLREDDKEILRYLSQNGGEASESSIRKKFLQPRTTMWRTVKRLERVGAVSVIKKDSLNIVRLRYDQEHAP